ncbi:MAG TPA: outer membrane protein assembly factor BamE [Candidatus Dormibacteraeota bacterium]|nr:outer membrane protein assembly factor BamE [Candidatus Dormibacteraeota bacterium]
MRRAAIPLLLLLVVACHPQVPPDVLRQWQGPQRYTCCNLHYEGPAINDANYTVGALLPLGTPVTVKGMTSDSVTFAAGATELTLTHAYGTQQESAQQYFAKVLVDADPRARLATFSPSVQAAINNGRVEKGMTREQVVLSLGYPPTHRTATLDQATWTYWYNRWVTYTVTFDANGYVSAIEGTDAPTDHQPVSQVAPPTAKPARGAPRKKR